VLARASATAVTFSFTFTILISTAALLGTFFDGRYCQRIGAIV
jgi:hypothetical protein